VKILVSGITGFVGGHLLKALREERPGAEVYGLVRPGDPGAAALPPDVRRIDAELEEAGSVEAAFERVQPEAIIHLAAQSSVQHSWLDPEGTLRTNLHGLLHLLEAVRKTGLAPRVLVVGSADEYGDAGGSPDRPLAEDAPLRPLSPYAVSKVAQGYLALQYALVFGMPIVRTRTFPHTGPGRGEVFAESSFARQIAEIEAGLRPPVLEVGNLEAVRDFSDVRDVVRAYALLLDRGKPGEVYNVCSGRGIRMGDLLDRLLGLAGARVEVRVDPDRLRPSDIPIQVGDPSRLREAIGWAPRYGLGDSLRDLLDEWRGRVRARSAAGNSSGA
jgi:GDP-4-dehydro-6-deoxy-D-mannose reductase